MWYPPFDPGRGPGNVVVGLAVATRNDVDRLADAVASAGHLVSQPPYDAFFGSRYAVVVDPDDNLVGLKSPIEADRKWVPGAAS